MKIFSRQGSNIATKFTLAMTALVVSTAAGVSWATILRERHNFRLELAQQAEMMLNTTIAMSSDSFYKRDFDDLERFMDNLGAALEQNQLSSGSIYQTDGRLVSDANKEDIEIYSFEPDPQGVRLVNSLETVYIWKPNELVVGRAVEIGGDVWGAVSIGLSTASLEAKITEVRRQGFYIALGAAIIGVITARFLSRSITEPIRELTAATQSLAEGNLQQKIAVGRDPELGNLAESFNQMSSNLQTLVNQLETRTEAL